ncbi:MAG: CcmD family protein [Acidobacteriota bacterium]|nr:CcmD family protein [Acidobacteriota bacterium]
MTDPNDKFLFLAYALVWIVFMLYAWSLARNQAKIRRDLDEIKSKRREAEEKRHDPASAS